MLPFGLCSAPKIFNAMADALNWCLNQAGIRHITHYLDDFIFITPPGSSEGSVGMNKVCQHLGVHIAEEKRPGPTVWCSSVSSLTQLLVLRLPQEKNHRIRALFEEWGDHRSCYRKTHQAPGVVGHGTATCGSSYPGTHGPDLCPLLPRSSSPSF